ncbi:inositol monophosphatase family protein [Limibacter armeniacum]|uniref:inositol monophosphatase family protein n=1 Tax=Limibacter armeniacum TaxID=466084 RepID=UPI002FE50EF7
MRLTNRDLFLLCQCAISAAFQAGHFIANYSREQLKVERKTTGESLAAQVVTEVDRLSQELILQVLHPTCEQYDLALLTEESEDNLSRLEKDFFWCIDPLDGTLPFTESVAGYSVSIALVSKEGTPMIGVIYDPNSQTLFHAIKGNGAFRNALPWRSHNVSTDTFTFVTDKGFLQHKLYDVYKEGIAQIGRSFGYEYTNIIVQGGAAMNACWVLEYAPSCYFKLPKPTEGGGSLWDFAASACIFKEANAEVSDMFGEQLELNRRDSTFMNHKGALYASNKEIKESVMALYEKIGNPV